MDPWRYIVEAIRAQGVEYVFGLGDTYVNMLAEGCGLKAVQVRHEGSAPFMAMAYARLTGKIGVCSASPGPGVANMVPGVLEAHSGCVPLVMPCPGVSGRMEGRGAFQECNQVGLMEPICRWSVRVPRTDRIPWFFRRGVHRALNGRPGPVFLELPEDVAGHGPLTGKRGLGPVDLEFEGEPGRVPRVRTAAPGERIARACEDILAARRPLVVAGNGAVLSRAFEVFEEFVERYRIPFLTTPGGRGILSEDHPLALGLTGIYRNRVGREYMEGSDLLITVGSANEGFQTHDWRDFPEGARYIQVDIDPDAVGRNWEPDLALVGDARTILRQLNEVNGGPSPAVRRDRDRLIANLGERKEGLRKQVREECGRDVRPVKARRVVHEVDRTFGSDAILVNENGGQDTWSYCYPYYRVRGRLGCIPVAEQTCMGMGVAGAVAAKLVRPGRNVVCITGDGAFQMYMQEMATAAQYGAGCTWVVLNNSALGWVKWHQQRFGARDTTTFDLQPDFAAVAEASGCAGIRVEEPRAIRPGLQRALEANARGIPAVVDVVIERDPDMEHLERAR